LDLLLCWLTNKSSSFCSLSSSVPEDGSLSAFVLIFINFVGLQLGADNYKIPAQQQALPLVANKTQHSDNLKETKT
jgi:hypothetical protein